MKIHDINSLCVEVIMVFDRVCFPLADALSKIQEISKGLKCIWGHLHGVEDDERDSLVRYLGLVVKAFEEQDEVYMQMNSSNQETMDKIRPYINELQKRILTYKAEKTAVEEKTSTNITQVEEKTSTNITEVEEATKNFRLKYEDYINDMDAFLKALPSMSGRQLKRRFDVDFKRAGICFKTFFADCEKIVPERKGKRGWNYNNIKNFYT